MQYYPDPSAVRRKAVFPGVTLRPIWGEKIMMSLVEIGPNREVPNHAHPHEQAGMVLQGSLRFTIGGETRLLRQGDVYIIPGGVEHSVIAVEGWGLALDVFSLRERTTRHKRLDSPRDALGLTLHGRTTTGRPDGRPVCSY